MPRKNNAFNFDADPFRILDPHGNKMDLDPNPGHEHFFKIYWFFQQNKNFFSSNVLGFESKRFWFAVFCGYFAPWIWIHGSAYFADPAAGNQNVADPDPKQQNVSLQLSWIFYHKILSLDNRMRNEIIFFSDNGTWSPLIRK